MKSLLLILSVTLGGLMANGKVSNLNDYYIADSFETHDFIYLSSGDCNSVFYRPLIYRYVPNISSTIKGKNFTRHFAVLEPLVPEPSEAEKQYVSKQLAYCKGKTVSFHAYPAIWTSLKVKGVQAEALPEGRWLITLEQSIKANEVPLIEDLPHSPSVTLKALRKKIVRKVSLTAYAGVAAEFLQKYWQNRTCTIHETKTVVGTKRDEHCEGTQEVAQHLRDLNLNGLIDLVAVGESLSSPRLAEMEKKLLSRWALSSFVWQHQQRFENTIKVTFGELKKLSYSRYHDEIVDEEIVKEFFEATAQVYGLETIGVKP